MVPVLGDCVDSATVGYSTVQHVKCGVPACRDVTGNHLLAQVQTFDYVVPRWQEDRRRIDDFERDLPELYN